MGYLFLSRRCLFDKHSFLSLASTAACVQSFSSSCRKSSDQYTIYVEPGQSKSSVIEYVSKHQNILSSPTSPSAVILTTPSFAKWLDDPSFLSTFLGPSSAPSFNLATAVIDSLAPSSPYSPPRNGFSILRGPTSLLPSLVTLDTPTTQKPTRSHGYLDILAPATTGITTTTIPLAHTIFTNGLEATLSASTWTSTDGTLTQQTRIVKPYVQVHLPSFSFSLHSIFTAPLIPILPPRKITGCLGNIISEIEVSAISTPASTELETTVPGIYNKRMDSEVDALGVEVWALLSPRKNMSIPNVKSGTGLLNVFSNRDYEATFATQTSTKLSQLLASGCELYRIESGGGGWKNRGGRLALETLWQPPFPPASNIDLDSFPSFLQAAITSRGLIRPSSYLQFLISPLRPRHQTDSPSSGKRLLFGSAREPLDDFKGGPDTQAIQLVDGLFTGLATEGVFVKSDRVKTAIESPFSRVEFKLQS